MLRKLRIALALVAFAVLTFFFLDFSRLLPESVQVIAKIQFVPALISLSLGFVLLLLLLTLVFGRIYCSVICPLGIYQDVISRLANLFRKKKLRYKFRKAKTILRWSVLTLVIITYLSGLGLVLDLLDPYSMYGRMAVHLFKPVYMAANNGLELLFTAFNNYTFYKVDIHFWGWASFGLALISLLVVSVLAWRFGRTWCNTICPVGTVLGFLSKLSVFKLSIDHETCNQCGLCSFNCKATCIDSKKGSIDYSRCVACFNCMESCNKKGVKYLPFWKVKKTGTDKTQVKTVSGKIQAKTKTKTKTKKRIETDTDTKIEVKTINKTKTDASKREFLSVLMMSSLLMPKALAAGFRQQISSLRPLKRTVPMMPPGAGDRARFNSLCTSCHLCVSKCPGDVLQPSLLEYGVEGIMQPQMLFDKGFCNYDCTLCTEVCPSGALKTLTKEEKHRTQTGRVVFVLENCIVYRNETHCGACSEHCPTQALRMVPYKGHLTIPEPHPDICIGCGGCEFICPVRPYKAVFVEGYEIQQVAKAFEDEEKQDIVLDDFGF